MRRQGGITNAYDLAYLLQAGLKEKAVALLEVVQATPFQNAPPFEKLMRDLSGACSRRFNIQHRLVYQVLQDDQAVKVLRLCTQPRKQKAPEPFDSGAFRRMWR